MIEVHYNGWIIYKKEDAEKNRAFINWMTEEAQLLKIELVLLLKEELLYGIKNNKLFIHHLGKEISLPHFVIMRHIDPLLTKQLEFLNVPVYNHSTISEIANNKAKTHQHLIGLEIPMIDTLFVKQDEFSPSSLPYSFPVVVKEVQGKSGNEVYAAYSENDLKEILLKVAANDLLVQKMSGAPGKDLRVYVIGSEILVAILRYSSTDFKANFTLGGEAKVYELKENERELVMKIVNHFKGKLGLVGIDFIFNEDDSLLFNEMEDVVGSRTVSKYTDINTVRIYLQHILSQLKHIRKAQGRPPIGE